MSRLRRIMKRAIGQAAGAPVGRQYYKRVWTSLSATEDGAKFWVQGSTDEALLAESAANDIARIVADVPVTKSSHVLEIGCGVGRLGGEFAKRCHTWTGCDVSPNMLQYAARRLSAFTNVRFQEISGYDLRPVGDGTQDVVYSTVVFMHLSEWDRYSYVEEAFRILKPGGQLYIDNISLTTDYGWKNMFELARAYSPQDRPPQIGSTSTPQEFEVYLQRAGFPTWRTHIVGGAWVVGVGTK